MGGIQYMLLFNIVTLYCSLKSKIYVYMKGEWVQNVYVTFRGQKQASSFN